MKLRFNSLDIVCGVTELQSLVGLRVNQIYDVDSKTYLIRLQGGGETKKMLLIESGIRFHTTAFEWPKNVAPSGFSMKLRKHLKNKRLEKLQQLGVDRIVDFQFGCGEAAYHIIVELYDRGNIILTDHEMTILYILRPHHEGEDIRFAVREKYPAGRAKKESPLPTYDELRNIISTAKAGESLRRVIMPIVNCGPTVIEHVLIRHKLDACIISNEESKNQKDTEFYENDKTKSRKNKKKQDHHTQLNTREFSMENDVNELMLALQDIIEIMKETQKTVCKGYIVQKKEERPIAEEGNAIEHFYQNVDYQPYNFCQYKDQTVVEFETFMLAVDEFYSTLEGQKIDLKTLQQEREALKKLSNVKKDHAKRIEDLNKIQEGDKKKAELITMNQNMVDNAILAIRSAIANQMSWPDIHELVKAAQVNSDPVACAIKQLKLEINHISLKLGDPFACIEDHNNSDLSMIVDVDLALSAWANARKYYDQKRFAAQKEQKTIDASQKALKSAERKTQQTLKDVRTISTIVKARKIYWFEKFYWFISSENYLVIGGRDAQQNELIVKRYMRPSDIYVHAEIQGASSVVVRNPGGGDIPPKTLLEAGTMAISYSVAWDAKVVTNAYWVRSDQVSKTAPTGEYLGTGSFMIRGKKNFLPSCHLIMGLSLLFKLEDSFIEQHRGERKIRSFEEEQVAENQLKILSLEDDDLSKIDEIEDVNNCSENKYDDTKRGHEEIASAFPDTQVKVEHDTGRISVKNEALSANVDLLHTEHDNKTMAIMEQEESTIIPAVPPRKKQQQNSKKRKEEKDRKTQNVQIQQIQKKQTMDENKNKNDFQAVKRGQKGKLKKIKAKYKDQDEEERQLRMQILKSAGKINENASVTKLEEETFVGNNKVKRPNEQKQMHHGEVDDIDEVPTGADVEMIDSLTGQPFNNDELLFVIPVVAPYQALQNYKFKVKLTPGTGKRGRAAKTAISMFSKDKTCTLREKDLLKSIRDETLARNIPGKVKLSAPQLQKFQK